MGDPRTGAAGVTVVTALRAESRYVEHFAATAESVLAQEGLLEWQLVYDVDPGYSGCADAITEWLEAEIGDYSLLDERVRTSVSRGGASAARHRGILQAGSDRFVNVDGDDLLLPGALERIAESLATGARFGLGNTLEVDGGGEASSGEPLRPRGHEFFDELRGPGWLRECWLEVLPPYTNPARLATLHADRTAYLDAGGYSAMPRCEEMLLLRNLDRGGGLRLLGEPTHTYRTHGASVTSEPGDELGDLSWGLLWR